MLAISLIAAAGLSAHARTLTAKDGRMIDVESVSYEGDSIRIKRADTGQVFTLPIDTFADAEQQTLRAEAKEAAAKPKPLAPGSVQIELSRGIFSSEKRDDGGAVYTYEQWGFTVLVNNRGNLPLQKMRAEYILFMDPSEALRGASAEGKLTRRCGQADLADVPMSSRIQFRTDTIEAVKVSLKPGWIWSDADKKRTMRDKLHGVWVRIYRGGELVAESATPGGLNTREQWSGTDTATTAVRPNN